MLPELTSPTKSISRRSIAAKQRSKTIDEDFANALQALLPREARRFGSQDRWLAVKSSLIRARARRDGREDFTVYGKLPVRGSEQTEDTLSLARSKTQRAAFHTKEQSQDLVCISAGVKKTNN